MTERGTSGGMEITSTDLLGDVLIVVSEALGELESQDVDLHKHNVGSARHRNKAAQERLCKWRLARSVIHLAFVRAQQASVYIEREDSCDLILPDM